MNKSNQLENKFSMERPIVKKGIGVLCIIVITILLTTYIFVINPEISYKAEYQYDFKININQNLSKDYYIIVPIPTDSDSQPIMDANKYNILSGKIIESYFNDTFVEGLSIKAVGNLSIEYKGIMSTWEFEMGCSSSVFSNISNIKLGYNYSSEDIWYDVHLLGNRDVTSNWIGYSETIKSSLYLNEGWNYGIINYTTINKT